MDQTTKHNLWFGIAVIFSLIVLFKPGSDGPLPFWQADKVVHIITFAFLAATAWWRFHRLRPIVRWLLLYAIASEVIQHFFIPGREWDILDVGADATGILIGLYLARKSRFKAIE
jgi:VanZ family protein